MRLMNIFSRKGDHVRFANPDNGFTHDQKKCQEHLKLGEIYTISECNVHSDYTDIQLKEVPGHTFNSVMFEDAWTMTKIKFVNQCTVKRR